MLLAIDAGNTNIVFAVWDGTTWRGQWRLATIGERTSDEYAAWLHQVMAWEGLSPADIDAAVIASVVPAALWHLRRLCSTRYRVEPLVATAALDWGFRIRTDNPAEVGADRLVNALAARARFPRPLVVVDFGTATTFDVVDAEGDYIGGVIAPGINLSLEALHRAAAALPRVGVARPASVIGRSTVPAMQSGIFWGYVGLIEGIVQRTAAELGASPTVIATGGLAPLFADGTSVIAHIVPDLTLEGLVLLAERNARGTA
ncbi:type III pantothenate kinase [Elioraea thermophila]|uniref:type III pantothenate kinase n=1 Tax=Elioraea thermophila TaxID=2185104 RepID=UPI000DF2BEB2|nr:type III pantothenate kinase [Elioraea thermophila]